MSTEQLKKLVEYHDDLYYNKSTPEITDSEYDALRDKLLSVGKQSLDYVPGDSTGEFVRYMHTHPITSLEKVNEEEKLRSHIKRLLPVIIEPKFDGLTIVSYESGRKVTRGNGEIGDDITDNCIAIGIPSFHLAVRGEAIISKSNFVLLNKERVGKGLEPFKNARNAASGIIRSSDSEDVHRIDFKAFDVLGSELPQSEALNEHLTPAGFDTTEHWEFDNVDDAVNFILSFDRESYDYELDGLVIKSDIPNARVHFGETGHHPKDAVAWKFPAQGKWSTLLDVQIQLGRTGKITPVGIIAPVELLGSTISRVTLHNHALMQASKLSIGCEVFVIKANDVIPAIINSNKYDPANAPAVPTHCSVCQSSLTAINNQLFCEELTCPSKLLGRIVHLAKRDALDIPGLSEQTANKIVDTLKIKQVEELFDLSVEDFLKLPGFAQTSATNLYKSIQDARIRPFRNFLYAVGLPLIGRTASKALSTIYTSRDEFFADANSGFPEASKLKGFGDEMMNVLRQNVATIALLEEVMADVVYSPKQAIATGDLNICVTGKLEKSRDHYKDLIEAAGHKFASGVTKRTTHLLAGEKAGSKLAKAEELGIPVLTTEQELLEIL